MKDDLYRFLLKTYFGGDDRMLAAVDRAYRDMMTSRRALVEQDGDKEARTLEKRLLASDRLCSAAQELLGGVTDFDAWHRNTCMAVMELYNGNADLQDEQRQRFMKVGQAQKWVNMTVKYIYFLFTQGEEASPPEALTTHLRDFHIPLDRYILSRVEQLSGDIQKQAAFIKKGGEYVWSGITDYERYLALQHSVQRFLAQPALLWETEQWIASADAVKKADYRSTLKKLGLQAVDESLQHKRSRIN